MTSCVKLAKHFQLKPAFVPHSELAHSSLGLSKSKLYQNSVIASLLRRCLKYPCVCRSDAEERLLYKLSGLQTTKRCIGHLLVFGRWTFEAEGKERVTCAGMARADWRTKQNRHTFRVTSCAERGPPASCATFFTTIN